MKTVLNSSNPQSSVDVAGESAELVPSVAVAARRRQVAGPRVSRIRRSAVNATRREVAPRAEATRLAVAVVAAPKARARNASTGSSRPARASSSARRAARIHPSWAVRTGSRDAASAQPARMASKLSWSMARTGAPSTRISARRSTRAMVMPRNSPSSGRSVAYRARWSTAQAMPTPPECNRPQPRHGALNVDEG